MQNGGDCDLPAGSHELSGAPTPRARSPPCNAALQGSFDPGPGCASTSALNARSVKHPPRFDLGCSSTKTCLNDGRRPIDFVLVYGTTGHQSTQREFFERNLIAQGVVLESEEFFTSSQNQPLSPKSEANEFQDPTTVVHLKFVKVHVPFQMLCQKIYHKSKFVQVVSSESMKNDVDQSCLANSGFETQKLVNKNEPTAFNGSGTISNMEICRNLANERATNNTSASVRFLSRKLSIFDRFIGRVNSWFQLSVDEQKLIDSASAAVGSAKYAKWPREGLSRPKQGSDEFVEQSQRIRATYHILQQTKCDPQDSHKRGLQWLLKNGVYVAAYPPHDGGLDVQLLGVQSGKTTELTFERSTANWSQRQILRHSWANFNRMFKPQPLNLIRAYFGEKVGFYFAWLGFYTQMLIWPSVVSLVSFLYGMFALANSDVRHEMCNATATPGTLTMCPVCRLPMCDPWVMATSCESAEWNYRFDHNLHILVSVFTLLWATVFIVTWHRKEAQLAHEWGVDAFDDDDQNGGGIRPEYEMEVKNRQGPQLSEGTIPIAWKALWIFGSLSGLFFLVCLVIGSVVALIMVRILVYGIFKSFGGIWFKLQFELASLVIHVLTFAVVMTLGWMYEKAAHQLTALECPRTQNDYISSYIWKVFVFELLNNFAPIFYAALIRGRNLTVPSEQSWLQEMCDPGGCLNEVVQAIGILLLARLLISNAAELGVPLLNSLWRDMRLGAKVAPAQSSVDDRPPTNVPPLHGAPLVASHDVAHGRWASRAAPRVANNVSVSRLTNKTMTSRSMTILCFKNVGDKSLASSTAQGTPGGVDETARRSEEGRSMTTTPGVFKQMPSWQKDFTLNVADLDGVYTEYLEMMVQFGYVTLFAPAFPLASVICLLNNIVEIRLDATNFVMNFRDFRESKEPYTPKTVWWQIMTARLIFFVVFVLFFYFFHWLCSFLVPEAPPKWIKKDVERRLSNAQKNLYNNANGQDLAHRQENQNYAAKSTENSATVDMLSTNEECKTGVMVEMDRL